MQRLYCALSLSILCTLNLVACDDVNNAKDPSPQADMSFDMLMDASLDLDQTPDLMEDQSNPKDMDQDIARDMVDMKDLTTDEDMPVEDMAPDLNDMSGACPWNAPLPDIGDGPLPSIGGQIKSTRMDGFDDDYLIDPSMTLKIGIRRQWGGSIVFFGSKGATDGMNNTNTIDANDTGREVQVALYDPDRRMQGCAWNTSCVATPTMCPQSISYLGWNPVQGGNRCNVGSPLSGISTTGDRLSISTVPLQWNPNWNEQTCVNSGCNDANLRQLKSDVELQQHLRWVAPRIVELRYTVNNLGNLDHASTVQEMPTLYSANGNNGPDLWRLFDASGQEISIDVPANDGFFRKDFRSTAPWVTLQNTNLDYGVGILYENGETSFQGWQNRNLPFNNVRAQIAFGLPANGTVHARAYLLLGSQATITADATALLGKLAPFGTLDVPAKGVISSGQVQIQGWALDNRGVSKVEARLDETTTVELNYGQARPDVCLAWPGYPNCQNNAVGYNGVIDVGPPQACPRKLEIIVTDTDGNQRVIAQRLINTQ